MTERETARGASGTGVAPAARPIPPTPGATGSAAGAGGVPLTSDDAQLLALEAGTIRGHLLKVLFIQDAPGPAAVAELAAQVAERLADVPRWRQRLAADPGTTSGWRWQDDPEFDIGQHVRAVTGAEPVDEPGLARIVAGSMMTPLDRSRPLWTLEMVPRLADGRWALIFKAHHCLADGTTMMRAGSRLIWTQQPPGPPAPAAGDRGQGGHGAPRRAPGVSRQVRAGGRLAKVAGHRGLVLREFARTGPLSPLDAPVGAEREVAFARCGLGDLRAAGKALDPPATINDVLLAVVAGALRNWLLATGRPASLMRVQVPVSLHPDPGAAEPEGNRDSFLFVALPVDDPDPVGRLRTISAATRRRKNRHDAQAIYALRRSLDHAPGAVRRQLRRVVQGPHEYSLNVSNVPGPATPIFVLGRRAEEMYPVVEVAPRHALRVAALSLAGTLFIGLTTDPGAVPGVGSLAAGVEAALAELQEELPPRPDG